MIRHKLLQSVGLALLLVVLLVWNQLAAAQTLAIVGLQPTALTLAPGESDALAITIDQADQLFGFELHLEFDPAVIQVVDANPEQDGVQVELAGLMANAKGFTVANLVDNDAGSLDYAMTLLAPAKPVSGTGDLLYLSVLAVAPGSSQLSLSVILASKDGQALPVETLDGSLLVVEDRPSAGATSTVAATSAPGLIETVATATRQPLATGQPPAGQSNSPTATAPSASESGADPRQAPRVTAVGQSSGEEPAISATAEELNPQAAGNSRLPGEAEAAVPRSTSSGAPNEPVLEDDRAAVAEVDEAGGINGEEPAFEPEIEQADSNLPWLILALVLILAAAIAIGRRLLAQ